jgi:hypothetical protein
MLLVIRPSGFLLQAKLSALAGTPFHDWRVPGILLATLVGGEGLGAYGWLLVRGPLSGELAAVYAVGLVGFEIAESAWIGLQALEVVFAVLALVMLVLAFARKTIRHGAPGDAVSSRDRSEATEFATHGT